jgi:hypothetical protein
MTDYQKKPDVLPYKDIQRDNIIVEIGRTGLYFGDVLTLPADKCKLEKRISERLPQTDFRYTMVEFDKDVYLKLVKTAIKHFNRPIFYYGSIADMIYKAKKDTYTHCFLDYCRTIHSHINEIKFALENNIVKKNGLITFTFALRDNSKKHKSFIKEMLEYQRLPKKNKIKRGASKMILDRKESITERAIKSFFKRYTDWKIITSQTYKDGMPMILFILQRI